VEGVRVCGLATDEHAGALVEHAAVIAVALVEAHLGAVLGGTELGLDANLGGRQFGWLELLVLKFAHTDTGEQSFHFRFPFVNESTRIYTNVKGYLRRFADC
jgi:hypothetical protein